ncbi:tetratricopeptide repeat protein [Pseudoalteromonas sp. PPB1]|uniref:tetratricopeptide repeat protein n=1 Tax=Pseudoalteromonas sp. PPB1 TaxID=2756136 RepID=UPI001891219C|nr:tetratricopeptide repeat protein [Pseudoalteromonas sp. PPB1]
MLMMRLQSLFRLGYRGLIRYTLLALLLCSSVAQAFSITEAKRQLDDAQNLRSGSPQSAIRSLAQLADEPALKSYPEEYYETLMALAHTLISQGDYDKAQQRSEQLQHFAIAQGNPYHHAYSFLLLGFIADNQSRFDQAQAYYNDALDTAIDANDNEMIAQSYERISAVLRRQDKYIEALKVAQKSINVLSILGETEVYARALVNLGIIQTALGDHESALETFTRSFELSRELSFDKGIADSIYESGVVYQRMENYPAALKHFKMAHELDEKSGNLMDIGNSAMRSGFMALETGDLKEAEYFATKSQKLYTQIDSKSGLTRSYNLQARIALKSEQTALATEYVEQSLEIANSYNLTGYLVASQLTQAHIAAASQNHETTLERAHQALATATLINDKDGQIKSYQLLADTYQAIKDPQNALDAHLKFTQLRDDLGNSQHNLTLAALQSRVEFIRKQQEIETLNLDRALKDTQLREREWQLKAWWFGTAGVFMLVLAIGYRQVKKRKLAAERAALLQEVVDKKNAMLADVSHEIRTPLTALQLQVEALQFNIAQDVDASYNTINRKLSDINRLISDIHQLAMADSQSLYLNLVQCNLTEVMTLWEQEFAQFSQGKGFDWEASIQLTGAVTVSWDMDRIKQVLTNLIANSTLYTDKPGKQQLKVWQQHKKIHITLEDTAPGVIDEHLSEIFERLFRVEKSRSRRTGGSGLGLAICKSLIEAHHGKIVAQHSELGGLKIVIVLPTEVN